MEGPTLTILISAPGVLLFASQGNVVCFGQGLTARVTLNAAD